MKTFSLFPLSLILALMTTACAHQPDRQASSRKVQRLEAIQPIPGGPKTYLFRDVNPGEAQGPRPME
jgi:hypothetical protein